MKKPSQFIIHHKIELFKMIFNFKEKKLKLLSN